ncbi:GbpC/Spa domain-containing protein, partial [Fructobacillus fructosus]
MPTQTMNVKEHFKMYKSGKRWLYASLAAATLLSGGVALSQSASADEVAPTTTTQSQNQAQPATSSTPKNADTTTTQVSTVSGSVGTSNAQTSSSAETTPKITEKTSGNVTKVSVDDTQLNQAVTDAKNEGVKVNQDPTQTLNGKLSDKDDLIKKVNDDYNKQTEALNAATSETKQYKVNVANAEKSNQTVQDAAKSAKDAGVDVTQEKNKQSQSFDDINKDNANQVTSLTDAMNKQKALNDAYNRAKSAADAANAAAKAKFDSDMAEYNRILADLQSKTNQNGYAKEVLSQELTLQAESHAKVTITAPGVKWDQDWSHPSVSDSPIVNTDSFFANSKNTAGQPVQWYSAWLEPGQSITVDYTDLSNSSYQSQPITKIQKTFTNTSDFKENLGIPSDPTMNVWYIDSQIGQDRQRTVKEVRVLYGQDGQPIKLGKDALISLGSLNAWY